MGTSALQRRPDGRAVDILKKDRGIQSRHLVLLLQAGSFDLVDASEIKRGLFDERPGIRAHSGV